jgi:hypothetical protein
MAQWQAQPVPVAMYSSRQDCRAYSRAELVELAAQ